MAGREHASIGDEIKIYADNLFPIFCCIILELFRPKAFRYQTFEVSRTLTQTLYTAKKIQHLGCPYGREA